MQMNPNIFRVIPAGAVMQDGYPVKLWIVGKKGVNPPDYFAESSKAAMEFAKKPHPLLPFHKAHSIYVVDDSCGVEFETTVPVVF